MEGVGFTAHWNTNETLFTLMLNYIAMQLVSFAIVYWETPKGSNHVGLINNQTKAGWLPSIGGNGYLLPIIIVMVLMVLMGRRLSVSSCAARAMR